MLYLINFSCQILKEQNCIAVTDVSSELHTGFQVRRGEKQ